MGSILKATLSQSREVAADSLLEFLEEKYDNKKWIVVVQRNNSGDLDSVWTAGGFHQATVENHIVLALNSVKLTYQCKTIQIKKVHTSLWIVNGETVPNRNGNSLTVS